LETSNRHAVDRLADVREQLRVLENEEAALRDYVLKHPDDLLGVEHEAIVSQQSRKHLDLGSLKREVGAEIIRRYTASRPVTFVRLKTRAQAQRNSIHAIN
jgi:hypothetical protein